MPLPLPCLPLEPHLPEHGAAARIEEHRPPAHWLPGPPPPQTAACDRLPGGTPTAVPNPEGYGRSERYVAYAHQGVLALYDATTDRHLWLVDLGRSTTFDRVLFSDDQVYVSYGPDGRYVFTIPTDLDGDGALEYETRSSEGGSGWQTSEHCITHGATGHRACVTVQSTAYSPMFGFRLHDVSPPRGNRASALLAPRCPEPPADPSRPDQGSVWAAISGQPPLWHPGHPVDQASVCLPRGQERRFPGAFLWAEFERPDATWSVFFSNLWQESRRPVELASSDRWVVYKHAHAIALYDKRQDRHAWVYSTLRSDPDGFKFDRWESIAAVELREDGLVVRLQSPLGCGAVDCPETKIPWP